MAVPATNPTERGRGIHPDALAKILIMRRDIKPRAPASRLRNSTQQMGHRAFSVRACYVHTRKMALRMIQCIEQGPDVGQIFFVSRHAHLLVHRQLTQQVFCDELVRFLLHKLRLGILLGGEGKTPNPIWRSFLNYIFSNKPRPVV